MSILIFKSLTGGVKKSSVSKYAINWSKASRSKFQSGVKKFLSKYWKAYMVYEEMPIPGSRLRLDFYNANKRIAIEVDGSQHDKFNKFFHRNDRLVYASHIERDMQKQEWCDMNGITLIRIKPEDIPLSENFFNSLGVSL